MKNIETRYTLDKALKEQKRMKESAEYYASKELRKKTTFEDYKKASEYVDYYNREVELFTEQLKPIVDTWINYIDNPDKYANQVYEILSVLDNEDNYAREAARQAGAKVRQPVLGNSETAESRRRMADATEDDVYNSYGSMFGVDFFPNKKVLLGYLIEEGKKKFPEIDESLWDKIYLACFLNDNNSGFEEMPEGLNALVRTNQSREVKKELTESEREFLLEQVQTIPYAYIFINPELARTKEFALAAVQCDPTNYHYVGQELAKDIDVILTAVGGDENILNIIEENNKELYNTLVDDEEFVKQLVQRNGNVLSLNRLLKDFTGFEKYRQNKELVLEALKTCSYAPHFFERLPNELQRDKDVIRVLITNDRGHSSGIIRKDIIKPEDVDNDILNLMIEHGWNRIISDTPLAIKLKEYYNNKKSK